MRRGPLTTTFAAAIAVAALALPCFALAHIERPSYWPDPDPDTSVSPPAGGEVPKARSLGSAVSGKGPGEVRVVCEANSLQLAEHSIRNAVHKGFRVRPSQPKIHYSESRAARMLAINRALAKQCSFHQIQPAVDASGNNDRIVIMPARYTEPHARKQPTNDPACADMTQETSSDPPAQAPSYEYQSKCPNDQNLIHIQGREIGEEPPPEPPLDEREGIPDIGPCLRCNLQIEGSGASPSDVVIDAGRNYRKKTPNAKPGMANGCDFAPECSYAKDVVLRVDRADGFVGRNFLVKSVPEHGLYIEEADGYLVDTVKMFWAGEYGNLTFTSDHGLYRNCDTYGSGDSGVYPGASPETGEGVEDTEFYPDAPRINTVVRNCDMRSGALAFSASQGNGVRITHNEVYANTTGLSTDSISAGGHPGYPPDTNEIDHNNIYSNNLDSYSEGRPFLNTVGLPMGVGVFWPGVNKSTVHDNYIFDNWRRGTMQLAVPEAALRGEPEDRSSAGYCPGNPQVVTSCEDQYYDNHMGVAPPGFKPSKAVNKFGNPSGLADDEPLNGVDFWWDEFLGNVGNCWHDNTGPDGTASSLTGDPPISVLPQLNEPGFLPDICDNSSVGGGDPVKEAVLLNCGTMYTPGEDPPQPPLCDWFSPPAEPGTPKARRQKAAYDRSAREFRRSDEADEIRAQMEALAGDAGG